MLEPNITECLNVTNQGSSLSFYKQGLRPSLHLQPLRTLAESRPMVSPIEGQRYVFREHAIRSLTPWGRDRRDIRSLRFAAFLRGICMLMVLNVNESSIYQSISQSASQSTNVHSIINQTCQQLGANAAPRQLAGSQHFLAGSQH